MNYTKGKWKVMEHNTIVSWLDGDYIGQIAEVYDPAEVISKQEEQANAERIVKAVNCHDDLYEALKEAHTEILFFSKGDVTKTLLLINKALARAEEK